MNTYKYLTYALCKEGIYEFFLKKDKDFKIRTDHLQRALRTARGRRDWPGRWCPKRDDLSRFVGHRPLYALINAAICGKHNKLFVGEHA